MRLFFLPLAFMFWNCVPQQGLAQEMQLPWEKFLKNPTLLNYQVLSSEVHNCASAACMTGTIIPTGPVLQQFTHLVQNGDRYAMDLAFAVQALRRQDSVSDQEDIMRSLGLSAGVRPKFFLQEIKKYRVPSEELSVIMVQTSDEAVDRFKTQRDELNRRVEKLAAVKDPDLIQIRNETIGMIQSALNTRQRFSN